MNEEWKSCVQGKPTNDGKYYVYISNLQVGDELRIMSYEKNHWNCLLEPKILEYLKENIYRGSLMDYRLNFKSP